MTYLLPCWLKLTGGEQQCARGRFALTMLVAYGVYHLALPRVIHCAVVLSQHGLNGELALPGALLALPAAVLATLLTLVSLLLAFLPLSPLALLGFEDNLLRGYELLQGAATPHLPAPEALWPYWLGGLIGAAVLLLAGAVAFGAAWRRLRDAGRSPLFLLLGLSYLLGFGYDGSYSAEASGLYLLGPLWLIILYSQPSREPRGFELFRTPPAAMAASPAPAACGNTQDAPAASGKQGARQQGAEVGARALTSSQPSRGKNRSSAGTRPSPSSDAASYRRRMRERVQAARRRS